MFVFLSGASVGLLFLIGMICCVALMSLPIVLHVETDSVWWLLLYFIIIPTIFGVLVVISQ